MFYKHRKQKTKLYFCISILIFLCNKLQIYLGSKTFFCESCKAGAWYRKTLYRFEFSKREISYCDVLVKIRNKHVFILQACVISNGYLLIISSWHNDICQQYGIIKNLRFTRKTQNILTFQQARHIVLLYIPLKLCITCTALTRTWNVEIRVRRFSKHLKT